MLSPQDELNIFMRTLESRVKSLTIPGFEYLADAITAAREAVERERKLEEEVWREMEEEYNV